MQSQSNKISGSNYLLHSGVKADRIVRGDGSQRGIVSENIGFVCPISTIVVHIVEADHAGIVGPRMPLVHSAKVLNEKSRNRIDHSACAAPWQERPCSITKVGGIYGSSN